MLKKYMLKYKSIPVQARASLWFLLCAFLQKGISSLTTPIFTRLLTPSEYGQYSVFNSWFSIVWIIVSLNLWGGVYIQGIVKFEDEQKEYSSALQGLTFTLVIIWSAIYLIFNDFWNNIFSLTTIQVLAMLLMVWTSSSFCFWSGEQRVNSQYRKLVIITLFVSVFKPVIGVILVFFAEDKVTARILGLVLVELVGYTGCFFSQMRKGKKFFCWKYWKYAVLFNLPLLPHYLSMSVLSSADRIMIDKMVGEAAAGVYSLAYSVSLIMTMFSTALMQTIEPWLYKRIKLKQTEEIGRVAYPVFLFIAIANILLMAFAPEIIAIFAPPSYQDAIWVIPPVSMSVYFNFAYVFFATFEFYYEKRRSITIATLIGAIVNVVLNYIYIGRYGYYAAGYTTLICYVLYAIFHYCSMRKICKDNLENRHPYRTSVLLAVSIGFVICGFIMLFLYKYILLRYILILVLVGLVIANRYLILDKIKELINCRAEVKEREK